MKWNNASERRNDKDPTTSVEKEASTLQSTIRLNPAGDVKRIVGILSEPLGVRSGTDIISHDDMYTHAHVSKRLGVRTYCKTT